MSIPAPVVEAKLNGAWVDISGWVDLAAQPIKISRGRADEQAESDAGTCEFVLVNDDGRFTIGNAASPLHPYWQEWVEVRVTVSGSRRYTGYVTASVETWPEDDENSRLSRVNVTCTDLLGMMAMSPTATSWAHEMISGLAPLYWWQMDEPEVASAAYEATLSGPRLDAVVSAPGSDPEKVPLPSDVVHFGVAGTAGLESDAQVGFTVTDAGGAGALHSATPLGSLPSGITILAIFTKATFDASAHWHLSAPSGVAFRLYAEGSWLELNEYGDDERTVTLDGVLSPERPYLAAVTLTATHFAFVGGGSRARDWVAAGQTYTGADLSVSGHDATVSNLAIIPGVMSPGTLAELQAKLLGEGSAAVTTWLKRACTAAGITTDPTATYDRAMERPALKGSNPAAIGSDLARAAGAMWVATRSGIPTWIDPTYCPALVTLDGSVFNLPGLRRASNRGLRYTEVAVDGTIKASTGGWPKRAFDIPPMLPAGDQESYVAYLANTADVTAEPRLSGLEFDLLTLDSTTVTTVLALDLKSRIHVPNPPLPQVPQPRIMTVEGYSEVIGLDEWSLAINTAPDPRFVLGTTPAGVLGSNYRLL